MDTLGSLFAIILDSTVKVTVLLALAWAAGRALKNRSSASRHLVRTCALCAALLLPLLSSLLPGWHVQGIPQLVPAAPPKAIVRPQPAPMALPTQRRIHTEAATTKRAQQIREKRVAPAIAATPLEQRTPAPVPQVQDEPRSSTGFSVNWSQAVVILWMAGAFAVLLRTLINRLRLALLVRKASPLQVGGWTAEARRIAGDLSI